MNNIHRDLSLKAFEILDDEVTRACGNYHDRYAKAIIQKCVNQMSDYLNKQRVLKHFGMETTDV